jgi:CheY-like chemotaxis protein
MRASPHPLVLLVQPNDDSREMYTEFLRHHQYFVLAVGNADTAATLARDADVIVTGITLEGLVDGVELIGRLRQDERTKRKPIIVLTAVTERTVRARAEAAGCDVFLLKPCLPDDLHREVRRLLLHDGRPRAPKKDLAGKATHRKRHGTG